MHSHFFLLEIQRSIIVRRLCHEAFEHFTFLSHGPLLDCIRSDLSRLKRGFSDRTQKIVGDLACRSVGVDFKQGKAAFLLDLS